MINNTKQIRSLLLFEQYPNIVYRIQIMKRRKDNGNEDMEKGQSVIEFIYLYSLEDFDNNIDRIIDLCNENNARAYFEVNPRFIRSIGMKANEYLIEQLNHKDVYKTMHTATNIVDAVRESNLLFSLYVNEKLNNDQQYLINKSFPKGKKPYKLWILDVDYDENIYECDVGRMCMIINQLGFEFNKKEKIVKKILPTPNGCHIIFEPTNLHVLVNRLNNTFGVLGGKEEIKKDNATILYCT